MGKLIGIEFGSCNFVMAYVDHTGRAQLIPNAEGSFTTPAVVAHNPQTGETAVGAPAGLADGEIRFDSCVFNGCDWGFETGDEEFDQRRVASLIFKKLKADAELFLGEEVEAVVAFPCTFGGWGHEALSHAMQMADFNMNRAIVGQIALAYGYFADRPEGGCKTVLLYDLGASFKCTLMKVDPQADDKAKILGYNGDSRLGGVDWDKRILGYVAEEFRIRTGIDCDEELFKDAGAREKYLLSCEEAKKTLSREDSAFVTVNCGGYEEAIEITRKKFDEITCDLLEQTFMLTDHLLDQTVVQVDEIWLAGGSSQMPQVLIGVGSRFKKPAVLLEQGITAKGAAIYGAHPPKR